MTIGDVAEMFRNAGGPRYKRPVCQEVLSGEHKIRERVRYQQQDSSEYLEQSDVYRAGANSTKIATVLAKPVLSEETRPGPARTDASMTTLGRLKLYDPDAGYSNLRERKLYSFRKDPFRPVIPRRRAQVISPPVETNSSRYLSPNAQPPNLEKTRKPWKLESEQPSHHLCDRDVPDDFVDEPEPNTKMLRQPETRPISHDQLVVEVKGIYAGLVMVEAKCIDIDNRSLRHRARSSPLDESADVSILDSHTQEHILRREPLQNDQWQMLIALHKQLLHEHHDFFLASQHPSASSNLSKLAAKYSMPTRMWRHGIHAFLEVLKHRLPESLEYMLAFIYIAYSMMALLYETVSTFEDTWIECLGDLSRYRMPIEDDEPKDREIWSGVACFWYSKAADKNPTVGRLYHHLAILARPYSLVQLSFYTRSLTCVTLFESARGSIMTLFSPILNRGEAGSRLKFKKHSSTSDSTYGNLEAGKPGQICLKGAYHSPESGSVLCAFSKDHICDHSQTSPHSPETLLWKELPDDETLISRPCQWILLSWLIPWIQCGGQQVNHLLNCLKSMKRCILPRSFVGSFALPLLFSQVVMALPPPTKESTGSDGYEASSLVNLQANITALILVVLVLGAAQLLVMIKRKPVPVFGTLMAAYSFGWWCIRNDTAKSLGLSWAIFFVWCVASIQYSRSAFEKSRPPSYIPLVAVGMAITLDLIIVRHMTPPDGTLSQADLLNLSLPSASLALYITAMGLAAYDRRLPWPDGVFSVENLA